MISEEKKYQCWLSDGDRILSFHPVLNYILYEFDSHEEFVRFIERGVIPLASAMGLSCKAKESCCQFDCTYVNISRW